jgi:hypothetical protein
MNVEWQSIFKVCADVHSADTPSLALALYAALTTPIISEEEEILGFSAEVLQQLDMREENAYLGIHHKFIYSRIKIKVEFKISKSKSQVTSLPKDPG